ncbi:hypothetical protein ACCS96_17640, partial [Rhizobium ruizarguesonis]
VLSGHLLPPMGIFIYFGFLSRGLQSMRFAKKNVAAVSVTYVMVVPITADHMGVVLPRALALAELIRQSISL